MSKVGEFLQQFLTDESGISSVEYALLLALSPEESSSEPTHRLSEGQRQRIAEVRVKPPKTKRSRRNITLPALTVETLRRHRVRQLEERLQLGLGRDHDGLVFTDLEGALVRTHRQAGGCPPRHVTRPTSPPHHQAAGRWRQRQGRERAGRAFERDDHAATLQPCDPEHASRRRGEGGRGLAEYVRRTNLGDRVPNGAPIWRPVANRSSISC